MTEYYVVVSLTDDVGKWEPGTVVGVFPGNYEFNPGDISTFFVFRVETSMSLADLRAWRLKKVFPLNQFMGEAERIDRILQKANIHDRANKQKKVVRMEDVVLKPNLQKKNKLEELSYRDTTVILLAPSVILPTTEDMEKFR